MTKFSICSNLTGVEFTLFLDQRVKFSEAESLCLQYNQTLARISSNLEFNLVLELINDLEVPVPERFWIGFLAFFTSRCILQHCFRSKRKRCARGFFNLLLCRWEWGTSWIYTSREQWRLSLGRSARISTGAQFFCRHCRRLCEVRMSFVSSQRFYCWLCSLAGSMSFVVTLLIVSTTSDALFRPSSYAVPLAKILLKKTQLGYL